MRTTLEPQQTAFYTQNGHIEFELELKDPFALIQRALKGAPKGRDLWRCESELQAWLVRKLGPIALSLSGKKRLHLACDQWTPKEHLPKKMGQAKELFSIQGFAVGVVIAEHPVLLPRRSLLGILPSPSKSGHVLFFRPDLLLDWPHVSSDLYMAFYALPSAVYVQNLKDPSTHELKQFGYNFGDVLKNEFHPLIQI